MPLRWKLLIGAVVAHYAMSAVALWVRSTMLDARLLILISAVTAAIVVAIVFAMSIIAIFDRHARRGWLHWLGLSAWLFRAVSEVWTINIILTDALSL